VQAKEKDDGSTFECAQSSGWRTDSNCSAPSDFMTTGEHFSTEKLQVPQADWEEVGRLA
jgi:hypothetical protein